MIVSRRRSTTLSSTTMNSPSRLNAGARTYSLVMVALLGTMGQVLVFPTVNSSAVSGSGSQGQSVGVGQPRPIHKSRELLADVESTTTRRAVVAQMSEREHESERESESDGERAIDAADEEEEEFQVTYEQEEKGHESEHAGGVKEEEEGEEAHGKKEKGHGEEGEEEEEDPLHASSKDAAVVVVMVLVLIALTVAFEMMKHHLEEGATEDTELILEKLFGELTILGFLAMCTFFLDKVGLMQWVASKAGMEDVSELDEYLESVHYTIFCVMVVFVVQVLALIKAAAETETMWLKLEHAAREVKTESDREWSPTVAETQAVDRLRRQSWWTRFLPQFIRAEDESLRDRIIFQALRDEFILDRNMDPPFEPSADRLEDDFNFGRYLALAQTHILMNIVEVEEGTWYFFAAAACTFYAVAAAVHYNLKTLAWFWMALGWFVFLSNVAFERHLISLRQKFMPIRVSEFLRGQSISIPEYSERTSLVMTSMGEDKDWLPHWCHIRMEQIQRPWLNRWLVGGKPNRQQVLFLLDRKGPVFYQFVLQVNLIFTGVYAAMLLLVFFPTMFRVSSRPTSILYLILTTLPGLAITYNKKRLVAALTQACSVGSHRKLHIVNDVLREAKTKHVVRTFIVISKMRCCARDGDDDADATLDESTGAESRTSEIAQTHRRSSLARKLSKSELSEIGKTFDHLDADGSGELSTEELREAMIRMSIAPTSEALDNLISTLDVDGNGQVDKAEFIGWYAQQVSNVTPEQHAREVFKMLDKHGNGEISTGEFKKSMDALNVGFTGEEIGELINELDEDRSGTVSLEEFEAFLRKYYPQELLKKEPKSKKSKGH